MFRTNVGTTIHRTDLYILVQVVNQRLALSLDHQGIFKCLIFQCTVNKYCSFLSEP